jgi:hypothetical protein
VVRSELLDDIPCEGLEARLPSVIRLGGQA